MPPKYTIPAISISLIFSLACVTVMGDAAGRNEDPSPPSDSVQENMPDLGEADTCPSITSKIIEKNTLDSDYLDDSSSDFRFHDDDDEIQLVTYLVNGDRISNPIFMDVPADFLEAQEDAAAHLQIWNYFTTLIPAARRESLTEYSVMTDGVDNILAAVGQTNDDPALWSLAVDFMDSEDDYSLTFTLIHEFAHLLTLGPDQVPPSEAVFFNPEDNDIYLAEVSACPEYFPGEGCARSGSYINQFFNSFWVDIYDEWNHINLEEGDDQYYRQLDQFYLQYKDQFLTDYSATHPAEDIADSFAFFVLSSEPDGKTVSQDKVRFFYRYPELIELRTQIVSNLCTAFSQ